MIINNLELIKPLLKFESNDTYYHLQILKRKKDCEEHEKGKNNNARCLKTYYISSIEYLELRFPEIQKLCKNHNARAYINLNAKSFIKTGFQLNLLIADRMKNNQFEYMYRSYESAAGMSDVNIGEKCWIGMNSVILPGVTLGTNTIVGADSIVTKSFPEGFCVIAGNPAKIIKAIKNNEVNTDEVLP